MNILNWHVLALASLALHSAWASSQCYTTLASTSTNNVPTSHVTSTRTWPMTITTTHTPTTTITPAAKTVTKTVASVTIKTTTITKSVATVTATTVSTTVSTSTASTFTTTSTVQASTTTTIQSTITISTTAGFTPVASTLPGANQKRNLLALKAPEKRLPNPFAQPISPRDNSVGGSGKYPKAVGCYNYVDTYSTRWWTKTATWTSTSTCAPSVTTSTVTTTLTLTSTVCTVAKTTTTSTSVYTSVSTVTPTATASTTTTTTYTAVATPTTYFAQCAANNIVTQVNGLSIIGAHPSFYVAVNEIDTPIPGGSAYDCCVACFNLANCDVSIWNIGPEYCYIETQISASDPPVCSQEDTWAAEIGGTGVGFAISNGNCGQWTSTYAQDDDD